MAENEVLDPKFYPSGTVKGDLIVAVVTPIEPEFVTIRYEMDQYSNDVKAQRFGQLALAHAQWIDEDTNEWSEDDTGGRWDMLHITSGRLIESLECNRDAAVALICDLNGQFDFDAFWQHYQQTGKTDRKFVRDVSWELMKWRGD